MTTEPVSTARLMLARVSRRKRLVPFQDSAVTFLQTCKGLPEDSNKAVLALCSWCYFRICCRTSSTPCERACPMA